MNILEMRLRNCLQTLLEVEPALARHLRVNLAPDFKELQAWLARIGEMQLAEEDVRRIERLAFDFLRQARIAGSAPITPTGRLH